MKKKRRHKNNVHKILCTKSTSLSCRCHTSSENKNKNKNVSSILTHQRHPAVFSLSLSGSQHKQFTLFHPGILLRERNVAEETPVLLSFHPKQWFMRLCYCICKSENHPWWHLKTIGGIPTYISLNLPRVGPGQTNFYQEEHSFRK